jgi:chemotaxis protein CheY-P-specific phosphatase CheC
MKKQTELNDELRPEYDMKSLLKDGVRAKYVKRYHEGTNLVLLEPDVAKAFPNEIAVNDALKLVMKLTKVQENANQVAK